MEGVERELRDAEDRWQWRSGGEPPPTAAADHLCTPAWRLGVDLPLDVTLDWTREDDNKYSDDISAYSAEAGGASLPPSHPPAVTVAAGRWRGRQAHRQCRVHHRSRAPARHSAREIPWTVVGEECCEPGIPRTHG